MGALMHWSVPKSFDTIIDLVAYLSIYPSIYRTSETIL